ncbi:hypothetical protein APR11_001387 [Nocardia amikacinitolerans]|nr:hypothetical protein [Nocardia amikacinitolerans]
MPPPSGAAQHNSKAMPQQSVPRQQPQHRCSARTPTPDGGAAQRKPRPCDAEAAWPPGATPGLARQAAPGGRQHRCSARTPTPDGGAAQRKPRPCDAEAAWPPGATPGLARQAAPGGRQHRCSARTPTPDGGAAQRERRPCDTEASLVAERRRQALHARDTPGRCQPLHSTRHHPRLPHRSRLRSNACAGGLCRSTQSEDVRCSSSPTAWRDARPLRGRRRHAAAGIASPFERLPGTAVPLNVNRGRAWQRRPGRGTPTPGLALQRHVGLGGAMPGRCTAIGAAPPAAGIAAPLERLRRRAMPLNAIRRRAMQ